LKSNTKTKKHTKTNRLSF